MTLECMHSDVRTSPRHARVKEAAGTPIVTMTDAQEP